MKHVGILNICLLFVMLQSCYTPPNHVKQQNKKMFEFAREVKNTDQMDIIVYGGGSLDQINSFSLAFSSSQRYDLDQARSHFLQTAFRFLESVNNDPDVYPYLAIYPFTIDQLDLTIIYNPIANESPAQYISGVIKRSASEYETSDFILYVLQDPTTGISQTILENYDKALNTLRFQQHQREMDAEIQSQECL